jgi:Uma2 family endonuclease
MTILVLDPHAERKILAERLASGAGRKDEVWDGVYIMSPDPNIEHQRLVRRLTAVMDVIAAIDLKGDAFAGCNISDRADGWEQNYRCPDIAVYLPGTKARFHTAHVQGGPDFAVEVVSENDRTWEKVDFYARIGTRELLIIDRNPWRLSLLRLEEGSPRNLAAASAQADEALVSAVLPLSFRLMWRDGNPELEIRHTLDKRIWHAPAAGPSLK